MRHTLALVVLAGCSATPVDSSPDGAARDTGSEAAVASACSRDTRADAYVAGIEKKATTLTVKIVSATPAPPAKEANAWTLEVTDDVSKAAITGAQLTVTPFMPDHGHGSSHAPIVNEKGAGKYEVNDVYLTMPGLWRTTISVARPNVAAAEEVVFNFCVDG